MQSAAPSFNEMRRRISVTFELTIPKSFAFFALCQFHVASTERLSVATAWLFFFTSCAIACARFFASWSAADGAATVVDASVATNTRFKISNFIFCYPFIKLANLKHQTPNAYLSKSLFF